MTAENASNYDDYEQSPTNFFHDLATDFAKGDNELNQRINRLSLISGKTPEQLSEEDQGIRDALNVVVGQKRVLKAIEARLEARNIDHEYRVLFEDLENPEGQQAS